jgi:hypothetical protein
MIINRRTTALISAILCCVALFIPGCESKNGSKSASQGSNANAKKITGSKEDLCRIVMVQNRSLYNREIEGNVIATVLSDGTGERIIASVDSMIARLRIDTDSNFNSWSNIPLVTRDLKKAVITIDYKKPPDTNHTLDNNIAIYDIPSQKWTFAFSSSDMEYSSLNKTPKLEYHYIREKIIFQATATLYVEKYSSIWRYNLMTGERNKFQELYHFRRFHLLPISSSECYVNFYRPKETEKNAKMHVGRFDFNTATLAPLPPSFDGFSIEANSVSEDGNTILVFHAGSLGQPWYREDTVTVTNKDDTLQIDTVFVFNRNLKKQKTIFFRNSGAIFKSDPIGKWLYFGDGCAIYRIRKDSIADNQQTTYDALTKKAEIVWIAPENNGRSFYYESFFVTRIADKP